MTVISGVVDQFLELLCIGYLQRVGNLLIDFSSNLLVFCELKSDSLVKKSKLLPLLFCHERPEGIAQGRSFCNCSNHKRITHIALF